MVYNEFNCRANDILYYYIHFIADDQNGTLPIEDMTIEEVYKTNHTELNYRFISENLVRDMSLI